MILSCQALRLVDETFHGSLELFGLSQGRENALMLNQLRAHGLDQTLSVLRAAIQLLKLIAMSHVD